MTHKRYEKYVDTQEAWLGSHPSHWGRKPLWALFRRVKRQGFESEELLSVYRDHGVIPKSSREDNFNKPSDDLGAYQLVEPGDLAVNKMKAWQGSVAISEHRGIVSPAYHVYRPLHSENQRFLHYLMRCDRYITGYLSISKGIRVNQWDLQPEYHSRMPVLLPPLDEQVVIASFLDRETAKIDALIAEQQRLIELLREKRQAAISHAVTKGLNPNVPMKDSGAEWLGEVPEHWHTQRLKNLFSLKHGYAFDGNCFSDAGEFALMSPGNFKEAGGFRRKEPEKYFTGQDVPCDFILKEGQMLIAMTEQAPGLVGAALFVPESQCYLHNQRLGLVTGLKEESLDSAFLYWLMNSPTMKAKVGVTATGQKVRHTSPQKILEIEACLPPLGEQRLIAKTLCESEERFELLANAARDAVKLLSERRSALISAAVTGQIDVRGLVEAEAGEQ